MTCPLHDSSVRGCPGCAGEPEQFDYEWIEAVASPRPRGPRVATAQENNDAQCVVAALELWDARVLPNMADWSPRRIMHALQVAGLQFGELDGNMVGPIIIALMAKGGR